MHPKISIITPTLNQVDFIEQCIDSVLSQGYPNLEYIVIDGGSTDGSIEIIKKFSNRLTYWESNKDTGQSHAINKGLSKTTGDVFNWLNSDDWYEPNALNVIGEYFLDDNINVVCGRENIVFKDKILRVANGTTICNNLVDTIVAAHIDQPPTFFRKKVIDKIGYLSVDLHYRMDSEFWVRYLLCYGLENVIKIHDVLTNFRIHERSKTYTAKEMFEVEKDLIFKSLAAFTGKNIQINHDFISNYSLNPQENFDKQLYSEIIERFLINKVVESYIKRDFRGMSLFENQIEFSKLSKKEEMLMNKMVRRRNAVPSLFFKLYDKIN